MPQREDRSRKFFVVLVMLYFPVSHEMWKNLEITIFSSMNYCGSLGLLKSIFAITCYGLYSVYQLYHSSTPHRLFYINSHFDCGPQNAAVKVHTCKTISIRLFYLLSKRSRPGTWNETLLCIIKINNFTNSIIVIEVIIFEFFLLNNRILVFMPSTEFFVANKANNAQGTNPPPFMFIGN